MADVESPEEVGKSPDEVVRLAADLIAAHSRDLTKNGRYGQVRRYLKGDQDPPYAPKGARKEYKDLARKSITNWLPLIVDVYTKGLFVDGFRPAKAVDNAKPWDYWQANGLDARQTVAHRSAFEHGLGWVLVLKGTPAPVMRPLSALKVRALFEDDEDEFPVLALIVRGTDSAGAALYDVIDDVAVYSVKVPKKEGRAAATPVYVDTEEHGMGVCPLVRFRDRLDGEAEGIVRPLLNLQDRINEAVFALMIALQFASFRQRWATGLAIPLDEDPYLDASGTPTQAATDADGNENRANPNYDKPTESFQAAVDRLWVTDSTEAKFGDFAQTEVSGHLKTYESAVQTLAAIAQTPPHVLLGDLVNLSADALAAAEASTQRKIGEYETIFGEAWEQAFRLAAHAASDDANTKDENAQVRWRDTEARSLAATVDALGKMAQMLQVPVQVLWERIPGVTDTDVKAWKEQAGKADGMAALAAALTRQTAPTTEAPPAPPAAA